MCEDVYVRECVRVCVHVSCVSGNVEMRAFTAEGIETQYLYFKTAHFCSIDNAMYILVFMGYSCGYYC